VTLRPFEEIVASYGPTVLRVCSAVLGPTEAEDAWSETFLAALKAYPALRPDSNVKAWLVTIAHRKAIDRRRAQARGPVSVGHFGGRAAPTKTTSRDGDLGAALNSLPPRQRQAVAYHYLAGLPYSDVAKVIGGSAEAARRAAADGIAALRKTWSKGMAQ
jgi:DNA-directed RNA polymerase specialized sigma24 family protein